MEEALIPWDLLEAGIASGAVRTYAIIRRAGSADFAHLMACDGLGTERTVRVYLADLECLGWITATRETGKPTRYAPRLPKGYAEISTPQKIAAGGVQNSAHPGVHFSAHPEVEIGGVQNSAYLTLPDSNAITTIGVKTSKREQEENVSGGKPPTPSPGSDPGLFKPEELPTPAKTSIERLAIDVLTAMNKATGRSFKHGATSLAPIRGRIRDDGFKPEDLILVAEHKAVQWGPDQKMAGYLRPTTLYGVEKFDGYLQEARAWHSAGRPDPKPARPRSDMDRREEMRQVDTRIEPDSRVQRLAAARLEFFKKNGRAPTTEEVRNLESGLGAQ